MGCGVVEMFQSKGNSANKVMLQHAREIAPSVSWEILVHVKRTGGISVNELAALLKMSYMGVKQHCDLLKKRGYVDTWRRPKATGRPEKIFRPTAKLDLVLPNWGNELCLSMLSLLGQTQGETAPERLLYSFLQQKVDRWVAKIKGITLKERVTEFVKVRNSDGWMSEVVEDETGLRIVEHHSPLAEVARIYPNLLEMESMMMERFFGGPITRTKEGTSTELRFPPDPAAKPAKAKRVAATGAAPAVPVQAQQPQAPMPVQAPVPAAAEVEKEAATAGSASAKQGDMFDLFN